MICRIIIEQVVEVVMLARVTFGGLAGILVPMVLSRNVGLFRISNKR